MALALTRTGLMYRSHTARATSDFSSHIQL